MPNTWPIEPLTLRGIEKPHDAQDKQRSVRQTIIRPASALVLQMTFGVAERDPRRKDVLVDGLPVLGPLLEVGPVRAQVAVEVLTKGFLDWTGVDQLSGFLAVG